MEKVLRLIVQFLRHQDMIPWLIITGTIMAIGGTSYSLVTRLGIPGVVIGVGIGLLLLAVALDHIL